MIRIRVLVTQCPILWRLSTEKAQSYIFRKKAEKKAQKNSPTGLDHQETPNLYELMPIGLSRSPKRTGGNYHADDLRKVFIVL
jgi:hypothetical protein